MLGSCFLALKNATWRKKKAGKIELSSFSSCAIILIFFGYNVLLKFPRWTLNVSQSCFCSWIAVQSLISVRKQGICVLLHHHFFPHWNTSNFFSQHFEFIIPLPSVLQGFCWKIHWQFCEDSLVGVTSHLSLSAFKILSLCLTSGELIIIYLADVCIHFSERSFRLP